MAITMARDRSETVRQQQRDLLENQPRRACHTRGSNAAIRWMCTNYKGRPSQPHVYTFDFIPKSRTLRITSISPTLMLNQYCYFWQDTSGPVPMCMRSKVHKLELVIVSSS